MPVWYLEESQERIIEEAKLRLQNNNKFTMVNARAKNVSSGTVLKNFWVAMHGRLPNDVVHIF